jgi:signal transduction histidine kinase
LIIRAYESSRRQQKTDKTISYHIKQIVEDSQVIVSNMLLQQHEAIDIYFERLRKKDKNILSIHILNSNELNNQLKRVSLSKNNQDVFIEKNRNKFALYLKLKFGDTNFGILKKLVSIENDGLLTISDYQKIIFYLFSALLIQVVVLSFMIKQTTIKPLRQICKQLQPLKKGDYNIAFSEQRTEEFIFLKNNISSIIFDLKNYQEERMRHKNLVAIGKSASMIAHDIRRPYTSLITFLELLRYHKDDQAFIQEGIREIKSLLNSTDTMLKELLEFTHDAEPDKQPYNLQTLITSALVDTFRNDANRLDIELNYAIGHTKAVYCNREKILRVFQNILENAGQALQGKGNIWIETRDLYVGRKEMLEINISNNGPPIPKEFIPNLFDPFFSKGKKHGTGLGLSICHKIVSVHGGKIYTRSLPEKTSFIIVLPSYDLKTAGSEDKLIRHTREIRRATELPFRCGYRLDPLATQTVNKM